MGKILINGRFLTLPMTGINRFAYEISKELCKLRDCEIVVPVNSVLRNQYDLSGMRIVECGNLKSHLWEQWSLFRYAKKNKGCLLLSLSGVGPVFYKNKITTIHDLSFRHNPKWFSKAYCLIYTFLTPLTIKTSKRILTVSRFSKSEILKYYRLPEHKIEIVYNALSSDVEYHSKSLTEKNYILSVGSLDPRKNLKMLIEAFGDDRLQNYELHIIGSGNRVFGEMDINGSSSPNVKMLGHIGDSDLVKEYSGARMFICPSLYEGFGIPPLEALSHDVPIVLSDIPVFREIYEDAARYFDPLDKNDLVRAVLCQLSDNNFDKGAAMRILDKFGWDKSARRINRVINEVG